MDKDQLYTEHMDEMFGITSLDNLTEEDVDRIITRVDSGNRMINYGLILVLMKHRHISM